MDSKMILWVKILIVSILFFGNSEGKQDLICNNGQERLVYIGGYNFGDIYPQGYTEGKLYTQPMTCFFVLEAPEGKRIRLTFNHIDIPQNQLCRSDRLVITDYINNEIKIEGEYCGNVRVNDFLSSQTKVGIQFHATEFGTGAGYNITYRLVSDTSLCKPGELMCRSRKCIPEDSSRCNGEDDCGDGTDEENCDYPLAIPENCGTPEVQPVTGPDLIDRIVGGREVVRGSWPWQVDMQLNRIQPNGHFCGGTLLNPQWFITAAHCIDPVRLPSNLSRIHLGNHHKYKKDPYEQVRYMKDYFVYGVEKEHFVNTGEFSMSHDLALVKLNAPVKMNPHVQIACLPDLNEELAVGEKCFATGWGVTRGSKSEHALKQADHPIQTASKCDNIFQKFENATMICAGRLQPLNGLCHGDSGGPLACKKNGKWYVYGAASFVTDTNFVEGLCGIANKPTVFNKISPKIDWIRSTIEQNS